AARRAVTTARGESPGASPAEGLDHPAPVLRPWESDVGGVRLGAPGTAGLRDRGPKTDPSHPPPPGAGQGSPRPGEPRRLPKPGPPAGPGAPVSPPGPPARNRPVARIPAGAPFQPPDSTLRGTRPRPIRCHGGGPSDGDEGPRRGAHGGI